MSEGSKPSTPTPAAEITTNELSAAATSENTGMLDISTSNAEALVFKDVAQMAHGKANNGSLKVSPQGFAFKARSTGKVTQVNKVEIDKIRWMRVARGYGLRFKLKASVYIFFDGFKKSDLSTLSDYFSKHLGIEINEEEPSVKGWNWGEPKFSGNILSFLVSGKSSFEIPLNAVVKASAQKSEASLEFSTDADSKDAQMVESMRFLIVSADDEGTDAEAFKNKVLEKADIHTITDRPICEFEQVHCITPRNRYDVQIFPNFFRMHGKTFDYKIPFNSVIRLFSLPHPQQQQYSYFVINIDPPIRQGMTRYPFIVFQLTETDESEKELNLDNDVAKKRFSDFKSTEKGGAINGSTAKILGEIFQAATNRKITTPNKQEFSNDQDRYAVRCTHGNFDGFLYPLHRAFLFVHKPTIHIRFDEIRAVSFERANFGGQAASQSFDLQIETKEGANYEFKSIPRQDYDRLFQFVESKKLNIRNLAGLQQQHSAFDEENFAGSDDETDPYFNRMRAENQASESEDEDFKPGEESDVSMEYKSNDSSSDGSDSDSDSSKKKKKKVSKSSQKRKAGSGSDNSSSSSDSSSSGSSSDSSDSGSDEEKGKKAKHKKKKVKSSSSGSGSKSSSSKSSRGKKNDPNKPKQPQSAFFLWLNENRNSLKENNAELDHKELMRLAGTKWNEMSSDDKTKYDEQASEAREEYKVKMEEYKKNKPESESDSDNDKKSKSSKKKDPNEPKKALSAFFLWMADNRTRIKEENPELPNNEISKQLGIEWNKIDEEQKAEYDKKAAQEKEKYKEKMKIYREEHPEAAKAVSRSKKPKKDSNAPKQPQSAFFLWMNENRDMIKEKFPDLKATDVSKKAGEIWKTLSDEEKKPFEDKGVVLKAQYAKDKAEYEAKHGKISAAASPKPKAKSKSKPKSSSGDSQVKGQSKLQFKSDDFVHTSDDDSE